MRHSALKFAWVAADVVTMLFTSACTAWLLLRIPESSGFGILAIIALTRLVLFVRLGMYHAVLRFSSIHTMTVLAFAVGLGSLIGVVVGHFLGFEHLGGLGRAFVVLEALMALVVCGGSRLMVRVAFEWKVLHSGTKVVIYGAGSLGELILRGLKRFKEYNPIGFIDDGRDRRGSIIHGRKVLGTFEQLSEICKRHQPELLVIAIQHLTPERVRAVLQACITLGLRVKKGVGEVLSGTGRIGLENLALEDLLSRPTRNLNRQPVEQMLAGRTVMVTGAGGSIGSELCRQIAQIGARKLVVIDHSEENLYKIDLAIRERFPHVEVEPILFNLLCRDSLVRLLSEQRPDVIFHAAAYKHVPMVEDNPFTGLRNNVAAFRNLLVTADSALVPRLVLVSTDKAVRPTNVMGASKRICELLLQNYSALHTRMCAVRFGNVLGSSGSVIPRFLDQIARGGPVTVTHPDMTRYFMLTGEAVELVLHAGAMASHSEIFILDMGEPVKIADMARQLIHMTGNLPEHDIKIVYTGLRRGEKLFEELLQNESEHGTAIKDITVARPTPVNYMDLERKVDRLLGACDSLDRSTFTSTLRAIVPEWTPSERFKKISEADLPRELERRPSRGQLTAVK